MLSLVKPLVYGVVDLATLGKGIPRTVGGEHIRFPPRWCRYYQGDYEPQTFRFLRSNCQSGQTVFDIGAHLGLFSVVMARQVGPNGKVFSFEPTTYTRRILERTVRLNHCGRVVEVRGEALAASTGTAPFFDTGVTGSNANSLVRTHGSRGETQVPTVSLDDFVESRGLTVGCVKIDVEGAELDLLRGAIRTLARFRPPMLLSLHPLAIRQSGGCLDEIGELIDSFGMVIRRQGTAIDPAKLAAFTDLLDVEVCPR